MRRAERLGGGGEGGREDDWLSLEAVGGWVGGWVVEEARVGMRGWVEG